MQIKTKIFSCHTADSKPVKQEVNSTVILPPLVIPGIGSAKNFLPFQGPVFVPGKPFQPSLMFVGKAGAYLSGAAFSSWLYLPQGILKGEVSLYC